MSYNNLIDKNKVPSSKTREHVLLESTKDMSRSGSNEEIDLETESRTFTTTMNVPCKFNGSKPISIEENMNQLFRTLEPFVHKLDQQVVAVRMSQQLLYEELCQLLSALNQIKQPNENKTLWCTDGERSETSSDPKENSTNNNNVVFVYPKRMFVTTEDISIDIEEKSRRLLGLKRRLTLVHSILQTVNSRVKKLLLAHDSRILQLKNK